MTAILEIGKALQIEYDASEIRRLRSTHPESGWSVEDRRPAPSADASVSAAHAPAGGRFARGLAGILSI